MMQETAERVESCWKAEEQMQTLAARVASCLDGWTYDFEASHEEPGVKGYRRPLWQAKLHGGNGGKLGISLSDGRVKVSGYYSHAKGAPYGLPKSAPNPITIAEKRGPEMIAREIKRRFLPAYLEALAEAGAEKAKTEAYASGTDATAKRVADAFGENVPVQPYGHDNPLVYASFMDDAGEEHSVRVEQFSPDGAQICFHAPTRVLEAVAALLKGLHE